MKIDTAAGMVLGIPVTMQGPSSRLGDEVYRQLVEWLRSTGYKVGERLPGERELAPRFGVSRPVLREALRALEQQGLIVIQPGRGIFVRGDGLSTAVEAVANSLGARNISVGELAESRRLVEPYVAAAAAERRKPADIENLEHALAKMENAHSDKQAFMAGVWDFHNGLAEATHNRVFAIWTQPMMNHIFHSRMEVVGLKEVRDRALACHREILRAVREQDAEGARAAAHRHIDQFVAHSALGIKMGLLPPEAD